VPGAADDDIPAVLTVISGMAYPTGEHVFVTDPADDLVFVLR
jgi:hypothetical protein